MFLKLCFVLFGLSIFSLSIFEWNLAFSLAYSEDEKQPKPEIHRKRTVNSEKEAEGTEALNRFAGEPIPKSRYELNGQSLEVDPD